MAASRCSHRPRAFGGKRGWRRRRDRQAPSRRARAWPTLTWHGARGEKDERARWSVSLRWLPLSTLSEKALCGQSREMRPIDSASPCAYLQTALLSGSSRALHHLDNVKVCQWQIIGFASQRSRLFSVGHSWLTREPWPRLSTNWTSITSVAGAILVNAPTLGGWYLLQGQAVAISRTTGIYAFLFSGLSRRKGERGEIGVTRIECSRTQ